MTPPMMTRTKFEALDPPKKIRKLINNRLKMIPSWEKGGITPTEMFKAEIDADAILWTFVRVGVVHHDVLRLTAVSLLDRLLNSTRLRNSVLFSQMLGYNDVLIKARDLVLKKCSETDFLDTFNRYSVGNSHMHVTQGMNLSEDVLDIISPATYAMSVYLLPAVTQSPNAAIVAIRQVSSVLFASNFNSAENSVMALIMAINGLIENTGADAPVSDVLQPASPATQPEPSKENIIQYATLTVVTPLTTSDVVIEEHHLTPTPVAVWTADNDGTGNMPDDELVLGDANKLPNIGNGNTWTEGNKVNISSAVADMLEKAESEGRLTTTDQSAITSPSTATVPAFHADDETALHEDDAPEDLPETPEAVIDADASPPVIDLSPSGKNSLNA